MQKEDKEKVKRTHMVNVRFNDQEYEYIEKRAKRMGMPIAEYVRYISAIKNSD